MVSAVTAIAITVSIVAPVVTGVGTTSAGAGTPPTVTQNFGFDNDTLQTFTVPANVRSRRVMERLGMRRCVGGDFEHPMLPVGHALRVHVLFRMTRDEWGGSAAAAPRSK